MAKRRRKRTTNVKVERKMVSYNFRCTECGLTEERNATCKVCTRCGGLLTPMDRVVTVRVLRSHLEVVLMALEVMLMDAGDYEDSTGFTEEVLLEVHQAFTRMRDSTTGKFYNRMLSGRDSCRPKEGGDE